MCFQAGFMCECCGGACRNQTETVVVLCCTCANKPDNVRCRAKYTPYEDPTRSALQRPAHKQEDC